MNGRLLRLMLLLHPCAVISFEADRVQLGCFEQTALHCGLALCRRGGFPLSHPHPIIRIQCGCSRARGRPSSASHSANGSVLGHRSRIGHRCIVFCVAMTDCQFCRASCAPLIMSTVFPSHGSLSQVEKLIAFDAYLHNYNGKHLKVQPLRQ